MSVRVEPLGPGRHDALIAFLAQHSSGCFCQFWHFEGDDYGWQLRCGSEPERNREAVGQALASGRMRGVVAVAGEGKSEAVVGWLQLCEAEQLRKLTERRVYRTLPSLRAPEPGTWRVGCVLAAPAHRGQGLAHALLQQAAAHARALGGRVLEAFPRCSEAPLRADEVWMGPAQIYAAMQFEKADGPDGYPVMRLQL